MSVRVGLDVLLNERIDLVRGRRVGLLCHPASVAGESDSGAHELKRTTVLVNALRASRQLVAGHPRADFPRLAEAVERLTAAKVDVAVRLEAKAVLSELRPQRSADDTGRN